MAASISYTGSLSAVVSAVTLTATSVEAIAHSLPTTPDAWGVKTLAAPAGASTSKIKVVATATTITFTNLGTATIGFDMWFKCWHSIER